MPPGPSPSRALASLGRGSRLHGGFDCGRQIDPLAKQFALDCAGQKVAGSRAGGRREGGRNASGLAGEPTLRDVAQESVRTRIDAILEEATDGNPTDPY